MPDLTAEIGFLAGPLGFEPRQSAPKALDLPLVDGPISAPRNADTPNSGVPISPAFGVMGWKGT
jgi:hypothetical protein